MTTWRGFVEESKSYMNHPDCWKEWIVKGKSVFIYTKRFGREVEVELPPVKEALRTGSSEPGGVEG